MPKKSPRIYRGKKKLQALAVRVSIAGSISLFLISAGVGIAVDSIALILDASASLVILVVALLMNFAIKRIHWPPDDLYNFGYTKFEPLTVLVQGSLIIATCLVTIKFAIQDIVHPDMVHTYLLPTIATFFCGIIGIFITSFIRRIGVRTKSRMLKTAGWHWMTDTGLSFGMSLGFFFGLMLYKMGNTTITPYIDPVMAILLAIFFIQSPLRGIVHNILELLDAVPSDSLRSKVYGVVEQYRPKISAVHRIRARKAGEKIFVDAGFRVKANMTVAESEDLSSNFEADLRKELPHCDVVVYFKPA